MNTFYAIHQRRCPRRTRKQRMKRSEHSGPITEEPREETTTPAMAQMETMETMMIRARVEAYPLTETLRKSTIAGGTGNTS